MEQLSEQALDSPTTQRLWFESIFHDSRLPYWLADLLLSAVPFASLLFLGYYLAGVWSDLFSSGEIFFAPFAIIASVFIFYSASYVRRKVEALAGYADKLREDGSKTTLRKLYSTPMALATVLVCQVVILPVYTFSTEPSSYTLPQKILVSLPFVYWNFVIGTFLWVFAFGMFAIYRMGRVPLKLKSFAEDSMLGLRPFGVTSLRLIGCYFLLLTVIFIPQALFGLLKSEVQGVVFGLILLGTVMFFLPLLRYRGMLLRAKSESMEWLAPQYNDLLKRIQQNGIKGLDISLVNELSVVEKLQKDIGDIRSWPFDEGMIARLAAIIVSISTVLLSSYIQNALHI